MTHWVQSRRLLYRWTVWFFIANTLLYFSICLNYLIFMPNFHEILLLTPMGEVLGWIFMLAGLLGQSAVFAFLGAFPVFIFVLLCPHRRWLFTLATLVAGALGLFLIIDAIIYHLYHYHLAGVVWGILSSGAATQVLELTWLEYSLAALIAVLLWAVELGLAFLIWRWVQASHRQGWLWIVGFAASLFLSYVLTLSTSAAMTVNLRAQSNDHVLVMESQVIPYYDATLSLFLLEKDGNRELQIRDAGYFVQNEQVNKPLNYPLHPLQCVTPARPLNIVIIVLDAWRFDMLNAQVTPHIARLAQRSLVFTNHFSGGNATRPGIFSLFYSIPPTYWTAMLQQHQGPVFIHQLIKDRYQMGIFRSASLHYPAFDQTVFKEVNYSSIETPGAESFDRDRVITQRFQQFIAHRDHTRPFFGFVFYDETHNYCESPADYPQPFQPAISVCNRLLLNNQTDATPYFNRYRNAAHFDDALVGNVLHTLQTQGLLNNTIVMVTADHGEEFNESHRDYWGHASDYTTWQIHTPMVIYWASQTPRVIHHLTTHYDVMPTLLTAALGCTNPVSDYSVGVP